MKFLIVVPNRFSCVFVGHITPRAKSRFCTTTDLSKDIVGYPSIVLEMSHLKHDTIIDAERQANMYVLIELV